MSLASIVLPVAAVPVIRMPAPPGEIVDVQAANRDVRAGDRQAVAAAGLAAAQLDQRRAGITRLREPVDQDRARDRGQGREGRDRLHALARDVEVDRVRLAGRGVGIEDRLPQRPSAAVGACSTR